MKRTLLLLVGFSLGLYFLSIVTDNGHVWRGLRQCYFRGYKNAQVDDLRFQESRSIPASTQPRPWPLHSRYGLVSLPEETLDSTRAWNTVGFAVIHRDSLLLDWTSDVIPGADTMRTNAFSAAKTLTAMAIGAAEKEGLLSVEDKVSDYLPRFAQGTSAELTIEQVLQMRSDIPYGENYKNPIGFMAKSTYGENILERLKDYAVEGTAGHPWKYQGGNTMLLQEILLTVIDVPFGQWFSDRIWGPLGATEEARWAIDNQGHERNYCCFYTRATEYALRPAVARFRNGRRSCRTRSGLRPANDDAGRGPSRWHRHPALRLPNMDGHTQRTCIQKFAGFAWTVRHCGARPRSGGGTNRLFPSQREIEGNRPGCVQLNRCGNRTD